MKKFLAVLLALLCLTVPVLGEEAALYVPAEPNPEALAEDFTGAWICKYAMTQEMVETESNLEMLGMTDVLTLKIEDGFAVFSGIPELGTDPIPLAFEEGALFFQPAPEIRVFTLRMLLDGTVAMTFDMIQFGPILYLFPAEIEETPEA